MTHLLALESHPGWQIYSKALSDKATGLELSVIASVRRGDFMAALRCQIQADVIRDCLNIVAIERNNCKLTLNIEERESEINDALLRAMQQTVVRTP